MPSIRCSAVIPARYDSQRFPGKVLADVEGRPLIQWVYERASRATRIDDTWVATDSPLVRDACLAFTSNVLLSKAPHATGTDRVAEVARDLDADVFVNVQADEPLIDPQMIDALAELMEDPGIEFASAASPLHDASDFLDPDVVKVVCDGEGDALYFSRSPIPWPRGRPVRRGEPWPAGVGAWQHIGIYAYRRAALLRFADAPRSRLEITEKLEQLRILDRGWRIRMLGWEHPGIGVDTEADLERLIEHLRTRE